MTCLGDAAHYCTQGNFCPALWRSVYHLVKYSQSPLARLHIWTGLKRLDQGYGEVANLQVASPLNLKTQCYSSICYI